MVNQSEVCFWIGSLIGRHRPHYTTTSPYNFSQEQGTAPVIIIKRETQRRKAHTLPLPESVRSVMDAVLDRHMKQNRLIKM